jgi:hypothetical protein
MASDLPAIAGHDRLEGRIPHPVLRLSEFEFRKAANELRVVAIGSPSVRGLDVSENARTLWGVNSRPAAAADGP